VKVVPVIKMRLDVAGNWKDGEEKRLSSVRKNTREK
jgi:hypothetical protein